MDKNDSGMRNISRKWLTQMVKVNVIVNVNCYILFILRI